MPSPLANLNGQTMPLVDVKVSALDRGFLFGDAVYEVLRVYRGKPWMEREHFDRLLRSLALIRIGGLVLDKAVGLLGTRRQASQVVVSTANQGRFVGR